MTYAVELTPEARGDVAALQKHEQKQVLDGIEEQLKHEPAVETRNRKRLRPNVVAEWELRLGRFRVFYNVHHDSLLVSIEAVGFKLGNLLFLRDERIDL